MKRVVFGSFRIVAMALVVAAPAQYAGGQQSAPAPAPAPASNKLVLRLLTSGGPSNGPTSGRESMAFTVDELAAMPQIRVTVHNPHSNADESYSGVLLIDLLAKVGAPRGKDLHGKGLSDYVVASGSDGYKAVLALAEVDPEFHPGQVIVADAMNGKPLDAKTGPFKLIVSEDKRPARSVHSLVSIEVRSAE
ncbi:MAG TPA: molybdopterin-dependent oxidoreductase [Acidisarcina sp.]